MFTDPQNSPNPGNQWWAGMAALLTALGVATWMPRVLEFIKASRVAHQSDIEEMAKQMREAQREMKGYLLQRIQELERQIHELQTMNREREERISALEHENSELRDIRERRKPNRKEV